MVSKPDHRVLRNVVKGCQVFTGEQIVKVELKLLNTFESRRMKRPDAGKQSMICKRKG